MIKVRICSEHKYDIILGKGKKPLKSAYELASLPYKNNRIQIFNLFFFLNIKIYTIK